jgi:hypothetical protein
MSVLSSDPRVQHIGTIRAGNAAPPDEARRYVRTIFPRTKERFVSSVDAMKYLDAPPWCFTDLQQQWIHDAIYDDGLGMVLVEMGWHSCYYAWWSCNCPWDWIKSPIYKAFPVNLILERTVKPSVYAEIVTNTPIVDLPGFEMEPYGGPAGNLGLVVARPGSRVHARWRTGKEDAIVSTTYGEGTTLSLPTGWDCLSPVMVRGWKYFVDFVLNGVYYAAGVPIPEDPELAHSLRSAFVQFAEQKALMLSLIDFIDKFGANTVPLHVQIDGLDGLNQGAADLYNAGEYDRSWETIQDAIEGLTRLSEQSVKLRQRALLWVYLTEWIAVSGTSMVCGFLLWTLMVRRRFYREVEATRLSPSRR